MTTAAWVILALAIINSFLCYGLGYCSGWLKCSKEQTQPALDGWGKAIDGWIRAAAMLKTKTPESSDTTV